MFCPNCRDEFRPGFTQCRACDVALVDSLDVQEPTVPSAPTVSKQAPVPSTVGTTPRAARPVHENPVTFCGFLELEEARQARAQLKERDIESEILIKDGDDGQEEIWLRMRPSDFRAAQDVLGHDDTPAEDGDTVLCAKCETLVSGAGDRCPDCGTRFEED